MMNNKMIYFFIILVSTTLFGCSMNQYHGDNMMDDEQYKEAVFYYEKALIASPSDSEIKSSLALARNKLIASDLISIRMLRNAGLQEDASIQLNNVLKKIKEWDVNADSAIKYTMNEETDYASNWVDIELTKHYTNKNYNLFALTIKKYNNIIHSKFKNKSIITYQDEMFKMGRNKCNVLKNELTKNSYFYYNILESYCLVFGESLNYKLGEAENLFSEPLILNKFGVSRDTRVSSKSISIKLKNEIKKHPLFSEKSKRKMPIKIEGAIRYDIRSTNHVFTHIYKAKKKTVKVISKPGAKEKEKFVSSTPIERTVRIRGLKHVETYSHNINIESKSLISFSSYLAETINETYSHSSDFKRTKIRPIKAKYIDKNDWLDNIAYDLISNIKKQLDEVWITSYCKDVIEISKSENASRCAILMPKSSKVANWSNQKFGIDYEDLKLLISD